MSLTTEGNAQPISCLECRRRKQKVSFKALLMLDTSSLYEVSKIYRLRLSNFEVSVIVSFHATIARREESPICADLFRRKPTKAIQPLTRAHRGKQYHKLNDLRQWKLSSDSGVLFSVSKKRALESPEESYFDESGCQDGENDEADEVDALNALGYMPHIHHVLLGKTNKGMVDADDEPVQSKELQTAIMSMPAKPYMGMPLTL